MAAPSFRDRLLHPPGGAGGHVAGGHPARPSSWRWWPRVAGLPVAGRGPGCGVAGQRRCACCVAIPGAAGPRPERIDPFTLSEPWRRFVQDALQARNRFDDAGPRHAGRPLRDSLASIAGGSTPRVEESWQVAQRGQALAEARRGSTCGASTGSWPSWPTADALPAAEAGADDDPPATPADSMAARWPSRSTPSGRRPTASTGSAGAQAQLRLLDARLGRGRGPGRRAVGPGRATSAELGARGRRRQPGDRHGGPAPGARGGQRRRRRPGVARRYGVTPPDDEWRRGSPPPPPAAPPAAPARPVGVRRRRRAARRRGTRSSPPTAGWRRAARHARRRRPPRRRPPPPAPGEPWEAASGAPGNGGGVEVHRHAAAGPPRASRRDRGAAGARPDAAGADPRPTATCTTASPSPPPGQRLGRAGRRRRRALDRRAAAASAPRPTTPSSAGTSPTRPPPSCRSPRSWPACGPPASSAPRRRRRHRPPRPTPAPAPGRPPRPHRRPARRCPRPTRRPRATRRPRRRLRPGPYGPPGAAPGAVDEAGAIPPPPMITTAGGAAPEPLRDAVRAPATFTGQHEELSQAEVEAAPIDSAVSEKASQKGSFLVAAGILLSRSAGLIRELVIANYLGTGRGRRLQGGAADPQPAAEPAGRGRAVGLVHPGLRPAAGRGPRARRPARWPAPSPACCSR